MDDIRIIPLTQDRFDEAVGLVLQANLDTKEEIEHHLENVNSQFIAVERNKIVGVLGWYQDTVQYATEAMGDKFPGEDAYWVGFFVVDPVFQHKGIGTKLLQTIEENVKKLGAIELWVSSVPETRFYYQKRGFEIFHTGKISGNTKFFMVKKLV